MFLEEKDIETARKISDEIDTLTRPLSIREFELLLAYELQTCSESLVGRSLYRPFRWIKSKNIELYSFDGRVDSDRLVRDVQRRLRIFGIDGLKVHEVEEDISKKLRNLSDKGTFSQHRLTQSLNCLREKNIIPDGAYIIVTRSVHIPRYTSSSRSAYGIGDPVYGIILLESWAHLIPNNLDGVSVVKNDVGHDKPITRQDAIDMSLVTEDEWKILEEACFQLYRFYTGEAKRRGFLIPDFKLEFGRCGGQLIQIDEAPTHDSARRWIEKYFRVGIGQESWCADKEFYRQYLKDIGIDSKNPPNPLPPIPEPIVLEIQKRILPCTFLQRI
jgi:hypothetical protein